MAANKQELKSVYKITQHSKAHSSGESLLIPVDNHVLYGIIPLAAIRFKTGINLTFM